MDLSIKLTRFSVAGWSSWFPVRPLSLSDRGSAKRLANAEASKSSAVQTLINHLLPLPRRSTPMGGQLRPSVRFHFRIPPLVCLTALHLLRTLRQAKENCPDMGVPFVCELPVHLFGASLLYHSSL